MLYSFYPPGLPFYMTSPACTSSGASRTSSRSLRASPCPISMIVKDGIIEYILEQSSDDTIVPAIHLKCTPRDPASDSTKQHILRRGKRNTVADATASLQYTLYQYSYCTRTTQDKDVRYVRSIKPALNTVIFVRLLTASKTTLFSESNAPYSWS